MTNSLKLQLRKLIEDWRLAARKTSALTGATTIPLIQGHMHGVSDGLLVAANDIDKLVDAPDEDSPKPETP